MSCPSISTPGIHQPVPGYWTGNAVPFALHFLRPRHVRALGFEPKRGKTYALIDGNELATTTPTGFFATLATVPGLPRLHISQPTA